MSQPLFMVEVVVDKIIFELMPIPQKKQIVVQVKCGEFLNFEIRTDVMGALETKERDDKRPDVVIGCGKSLVFPMSTEDMKSNLNKSPLELTLMTRQQTSPLGTTSIPWNEDFFEMLESCEDSFGYVSPVFANDYYPVDSADGKLFANMLTFVRLTFLGPNIATQVQILEGKADAAKDRTYLFKNANNATTFQCEKYGMGSTSDLLAVAPIYEGVNHTPEQIFKQMGIRALKSYDSIRPTQSLTPSVFGNDLFKNMFDKNSNAGWNDDIASIQCRVDDLYMNFMELYKEFSTMDAASVQQFVEAFGDVFGAGSRSSSGKSVELNVDYKTLTVQEIEGMLCTHPDCPAAKKFAEYGIGPLAKTKGLGGMYKPVEAPISYGLSHLNGTIDNYGPMGTYTRPKSPEQDFIPKKDKDSTCSKCSEGTGSFRLSGGADNDLAPNAYNLPSEQRDVSGFQQLYENSVPSRLNQNDDNVPTRISRTEPTENQNDVEASPPLRLIGGANEDDDYTSDSEDDYFAAHLKPEFQFRRPEMYKRQIRFDEPGPSWYNPALQPDENEQPGPSWYIPGQFRSRSSFSGEDPQACSYEKENVNFATSAEKIDAQTKKIDDLQCGRNCGESFGFISRRNIACDEAFDSERRSTMFRRSNATTRSFASKEEPNIMHVNDAPGYQHRLIQEQNENQAVGRDSVEVPHIVGPYGHAPNSFEYVANANPEALTTSEHVVGPAGHAPEPQTSNEETSLVGYHIDKPLRLKGGAPILKESTIPDPKHECQDLMEEFDKLLSDYKNVLGPCGQATCPFAQNLVKETCRLICHPEPEDCSLGGSCKSPSAKTPAESYTENFEKDQENVSGCAADSCPYKREIITPVDKEFKKKQFRPGCESPHCPFQREKLGMEPADDMHVRYQPCAGKECPFTVPEELPPIHWDCPEPLPKGRCTNPDCPLVRKEDICKKYFPEPQGPCGNPSCPYATVPCTFPGCPFAMPEPCPPVCPYTTPVPETLDCTPSICPFAEPKDDMCENPTCPYKKKKKKKKDECEMPPCGIPKQKDECDNPQCPFKKKKKNDCDDPECIIEMQKKQEHCKNPQCPLEKKKEEECENPECPFKKPKEEDELCDNPKCPFKQDLCPHPQCPFQDKNLEICPNPKCPFQDKSKLICPNPKCPHAKKYCPMPDCPFQQPEKDTCDHPKCPYKKKQPKCGQGDYCNNPACPYVKNLKPVDKQGDKCSSPPPKADDECDNPTCPYKKKKKEPECEHPACTSFIQSLSDTDDCNITTSSLNQCSNPACPFAKAEAIRAALDCGNPSCPYAKYAKILGEHAAQYDMEVCDNPKCPYKKSKGESMDPCNEDTCANLNEESESREPEKLKEESLKNVAKRKGSGDFEKPKTVPKEEASKAKKGKGKKKKKGRKERKYVYDKGTYYPGNKIGHRECIIPKFHVPPDMGWLWNVHTKCMQLRPRRGWKPGAIGRTIAARIDEHRKKFGMHPITKPAKTKKRRRRGPDGTEYSSDSDMDVAPKPTLQVKKKDGIVYVTMNPLKDPKTLEDNENPYMDCSPLQFKITKNKPAKNDEFKMCYCGEEEEECEAVSSSSSSELDIEFTPPAGIIHPERLKKKKPVVHTDTQYCTEDIPKQEKPKKGKKGKDKKKGKKGKKK